jgi:hypothetical protein
MVGGKVEEVEGAVMGYLVGLLENFWAKKEQGNMKV